MITVILIVLLTYNGTIAPIWGIPLATLAMLGLAIRLGMAIAE